MEEPSERGGLMQEGRRFLAAGLRYASARFRLAALEGKEAGGHVVKLLVLVIGAILMVVLSWVFICLALAFLIARGIGGENAWMWAMLIMAGMHVLLAVLMALGAKAGLSHKFFPLTTEELKKDQEWLEKKTKHD